MILPQHDLDRSSPLCPANGMRGLRSLISILALLLAIVSVSAPRLLSMKQLDALQDHYGQAAVTRIQGWQKMLLLNQHEAELQKLEAVNDFFNRMRFVSDLEHWGKKDYWATPIEFIATAGGDCEDFSIAKYFSLLELGIAAEKLRLIYVKASSINQAHMVLGYYATPNAEPKILDNLEQTIKPASLRPDLIPSYSFNGNNLWAAKMLREGGKKVGKSENIGVWRMLMERMNALR